MSRFSFLSSFPFLFLLLLTSCDNNDQRLKSLETRVTQLEKTLQKSETLPTGSIDITPFIGRWKSDTVKEPKQIKEIRIGLIKNRTIGVDIFYSSGAMTFGSASYKNGELEVGFDSSKPIYIRHVDSGGTIMMDNQIYSLQQEK